jgi:hypothetical protein
MSIHSLAKKRADRDFPAFVPSGSRNVPRVVFVVIDEEGLPCYCNADRGSAHHWINAVIEASEDGASMARHWVVREYRVAEAAAG